jgi:hypothetical protein
MANMLDIEMLQGKFDPELDNNWMHQASEEIAENKWQRPPTLVDSNYYLNSALKYIHYPHIDPSCPNKMRFFNSIADGRKGKRTSMRIGRYLTKHFGKSIGNEGAVLQEQQRIIYETAPVDVLFASTEDDIENVYMNGPRSCMSKKVSNMQVNQHPVRMYCAGDLQVAYILGQDGEKPGARAVVWPEHKKYVRIYGDMARLKRGLETLGYTRTDGFDGAKIKRVEYSNTFIVPYVDGIARYVQPAVDTGTTLTLRTSSSCVSNRERYEISSEWGWLWEPDPSCNVCEVNGTVSHGDGVNGITVVSQTGTRFSVLLCDNHRENYDVLWETLGLARCVHCNTLHEVDLERYTTNNISEIPQSNCARCPRVSISLDEAVARAVSYTTTTDGMNPSTWSTIEGEATFR